MYVGVKMKKSQLRNIIKQVITEQMQPVAHKSIGINVCGCIDKLNAPLTFGGSTYCDGPLPQSGMAGFNAFGSNMGPVTAFQCDGMPCTQQHVTSGQIFSLKIYGAYPNNNDHVATLFGSLIYYALPTNTLNSNPYQGVEQLMPSSCPTGPGHLHTNLDNDRDNLFVTLSIRTYNPNIHIISRCAREENKNKLIRAGANRVINPYISGGHKMAEILSNPKLEFLEILFAFLLFRFFDILKIFPANIVDKKYSGHYGVIFDDIIAAIQALIVIFIFKIDYGKFF